MTAISYISEPVEITFNSASYESGDYALIYANGGFDADVSFTAAHDNRKISLFELWHSADGWGESAWGSNPWGTPTVNLTVSTQIDQPEEWKFSLKTYDTLGNVEADTPGEAEIYMTPIPKKPGGWSVTSYDSATDILTLTVST